MAGVKILIADDESRMRKLVADFLKKEGFIVFEAEDGKKALQLFEENPDFGLVILDVMMPGYDGWAVCREIRTRSSIPVIILTARGEERDELFGFDLGADEYITKPFSPMVLMARIHALLRRSARGGLKTLKIYEGMEIDESGRVVRVDGRKVDLSPKEFELLLYLSCNDGIAVSREQILNSVWNYDYYGDARTVDTHIKKLRLKLGVRGGYIQTVRGLGYKFEATS